MTARSAATAGGTVPSACAGVHGSAAVHSEAQPAHRNSARPPARPAGPQSHSAWQG